MVLMSGFFTCIKMTLLFFYRRLFRVPNNSGLNIYWKANFAYVVLWFFGSTGFYLFQCWPVQWYFMQYFARFKKPVPGGMTGQCDATTVLHVSMPLIFSLISDFALLLLPLWAISKLKLNRNKKRGLMVVFGIGLVACFLELGRILALIIHTDDKDDPPCKSTPLISLPWVYLFLLLPSIHSSVLLSDGVATFLILTAAEETTAVVCACLPVIAPMIARAFKSKAVNSDVYGGSGAQGSSGERSARGFKRVGGLNSLWTTTSATKVDSGHDDGVPLTKVEVTGNDRPGLDSGSQNEILDHARRPVRATEHQTARVYPASRRHEPIDLESAGDIRVRTDIQVRVGTLQDGRGRFAG